MKSARQGKKDVLADVQTGKALLLLPCSSSRSLQGHLGHFVRRLEVQFGSVT